jgi:hypothetical protein
MKQLLIYSTLITLVVAFLPMSIWAQYDDLYYNPDNYHTTTLKNHIHTGTGSDISFGDQDFDNQSYDYLDDYDFYYSSRIRRFHRPARGIDFYDPYFVDLVYYGYHSPGVTIYVSPHRFRPYRPHAFSYYHWHHHDPFFNPYYSWHNPWRPYRPYRPYGGFHSYGFGYGYSSWGGYGYAGCPIFYTSNHYYVNNYYTARPGSGSQRPSDDIRSRRGTQYGPAGSTGGAAPRSGRSVAGGTNDEGVGSGTPSDERTTGSSSGRISAPQSDEQIDTRSREIAGERRSSISEDRIPASEDAAQQTARGRTSGTDFAGISPSNERTSAGRQAQQNFRDNRVTRDQFQTDRRTNVPQPANTNRSRSTDQRTPAFDGRTQQRNNPADMRSNQGRSDQPTQRGIDQNRQRQPSTQDLNRNRSNQRSTPPTINNNRGSNQRGSGVNPSSGSNQRSPSVSPPSSNPPRSSGTNTRSSNTRSSGSDTPRSSGRSGRGG